MAQAGTPTKPRSRIIRRERPIIERPRLIKKLDECDARTILLLAPAGYGKTTLARQWAKTLSRVIWVSLTSAHRDVTVLARDLARSIEELGDEGFVDFMEQYLKARQNPQKEAREIGLALAEGLRRVRLPWVALDDYHELTGIADAERLVEGLRTESASPFLISSRVRPNWARHRQRLYGEVAEFRQDDLAMDAEESIAVVGREGHRVARLLSLARGWPAVIALAAQLDFQRLPAAALPEVLHGFLAEELFSSLPEETKNYLTQIALRPSLNPSSEPNSPAPGDSAAEIEAVLDEHSGLHPLLRDFLLSKLDESPEGKEDVRASIEQSLIHHEWSTAFELIARFRIQDMVDQAIRASFRELMRDGQLWTLTDFVTSCMSANTDISSGAMSLVLAEAASADGDYELGRQLAERACRQLAEDDSLRPVAAIAVTRAAILSGDQGPAEVSYAEARRLSTDERDVADGLYFVTTHGIAWETPNGHHIDSLRSRRDRSALDLVRYGNTVVLSERLSSHGYSDDGLISECLDALPLISDPLVSTSALWNFAYSYFLQSRYDEALELLADVRREAETFRLLFVTPFVSWMDAGISLGKRDVGACDRYLSHAEKSIEGRYVLFHDLNIRALRARMYLQIGKTTDALDCVGPTPTGRTIPSMRAEYIATRALVLAVARHEPAALLAAAEASDISNSVEAIAYAEAATCLIGFRSGDLACLDEPFRRARSTKVWDPLISLVRSAPDFAAGAAQCETTRYELQLLCERIDDRPLARQTSLRIRSSSPTKNPLSQRENEVLGLIAQGFRNSEIARTLFISESTVKVHVRHIFEKLGVKTRAEAAVRVSSR